MNGVSLRRGGDENWEGVGKREFPVSEVIRNRGFRMNCSAEDSAKEERGTLFLWNQKRRSRGVAMSMPFGTDHRIGIGRLRSLPSQAPQPLSFLTMPSLRSLYCSA